MAKKEVKKKKPKSLDEVIANVNGHFGTGTIVRASDAIGAVIDRVPFGIFDLDMRIGGGVPRGRISMLKGEYSGGKTALTLAATSQFQRHCRFCGTQFEFRLPFGEVVQTKCSCKKNEPMRVLLVDAEHAFDPDWAFKWGVNCEDLYIIEPTSAEQAIDVAGEAIRSGHCDLLVVDSIAGLAPNIEVNTSSADANVGVAARLMNRACRIWTSGMNAGSLLERTKSTILLVNQMRINIGGYSPNPQHPAKTSPGGKGIDFFQSLEVRVTRKEYIELEAAERNIGIRVKYRISKNRTAPNGTPIGEFDLYFSKVKGLCEVGGTNTAEQVSKFAEYWGLIKRSGAHYSLDGERIAHGRSNLAVFLNAHPEILEKLIDGVKAKELSWQEDGDHDFGAAKEEE